MQNRIFGLVEEDDPFRQAAGLRDGAMSALTGICGAQECQVWSAREDRVSNQRRAFGEEALSPARFRSALTPSHLLQLGGDCHAVH